MADRNANIKASSSEQFTHYVNFEGLNLTTNEVGLYRFSLASRQPLTLGMSNYEPIMTDKVMVKDQNGKNQSDVKGQAPDPTGDLTIDYNDDLNTIQSNAYGMPKSFIDSVFKGMVIDYGGDKIRIVSTVGAILNAEDEACATGLEFGGLFRHEAFNLFDGVYVDDDGNRLLKANAYHNTRQFEATAVMLECVQNLGDRRRNLMMPAIYTSMIDYNQNSAGLNSLSLTAQYCTECWERETYFMDGVYNGGADADVDKLEYEVDYIMISASDPTDFGTSGDKAVIIDPTTGAFAVKSSDGATTWTTVATGTIKQYGRIWANKIGTTTLAGATDQNGFVTVKTSGADNTGVAHNYAYDKTGATLNYVCKCYELDRNAEALKPYVTTSVC